MSEQDLMRDQIRNEFERERGYWRPWNDTLLRERPHFLQNYARYAGHPARTGPLSERMIELIYVGLDASSSHLFEAGLRVHMEKALKVGASRQDIFDVLHLVAGQGIECTLQGIEILAEEISQTQDVKNVSGESAFDWLAWNDPSYAELTHSLMSDGFSTEGLSPAERCLVQIALHACFTAFNPKALREHIRKGIEIGLSSAQTLQSIQLGAHLSVHGTALGAQVFETLN
jgi:alkylhydroperoxidase/carboxymuconolactone decarboxylase family protein YurZ